MVMPTIKQLRKALRAAVSDSLSGPRQAHLDEVDTRVRLGVAVKFYPESHVYLVVPWEDYPYFVGGGPARMFRCRSMEPLISEEGKFLAVPPGVEAPDGGVELDDYLPCVFVELNGVGGDMGFLVLGFLHMPGDRELGFKEGEVLVRMGSTYLRVRDGFASISTPFCRVGVTDDVVDLSSGLEVTGEGLRADVSVTVSGEGVSINSGSASITLKDDNVKITCKDLIINGVKYEDNGGEG